MEIAISLGGCDLTSRALSTDEAQRFDVHREVRKVDLAARKSQSIASDSPSDLADTSKPSVYYGTDTPPPVDRKRDDYVVAYSGSDAPVSANLATANGDRYQLNFENSQVTTVAKVILSDILDVGYTIDPRVQGTVTLASGRPIPKSDLVYVLESTLRLNNVALVKGAGGYRLIPAGEAAGSGTVDSAADGQPEPGYGVTIMPLRYVSAPTLVKLLDNFALKPGMVRPDPARNLLVIQGTGAERKNAVDIVLNFDADWMRGQSVGIYPVHNATPEPVIAELEKVMETAEGGLGHNLVKFEPVTRLNAILVVAGKPSLLKSAATWISRLDSSDSASSGVKVYRVKYGDARQLAKILNDLFTGKSSEGLDSPTNQIAPGAGLVTSSSRPGPGLGGASSTGGAGTQLASAAGATLPSAPGAMTGGTPDGPLAGFNKPISRLAGPTNPSGPGTNGSPGGPLGGPAILPDVRISADVANNSLLIFANHENYRIIEKTLRQLDRPLLQVAIDATIAEVTLNDNLNYGVQFYLSSVNPHFSVGNFATLPIAPTIPGFNFLLGSTVNPKVVLDALRSVTDVKVLSAPSIVVLDNQPAALLVGDQVPITTGTATVLTNSNTPIVSSIDYRNTGVILQVLPRITSNGNVMLDIAQEISQVSNPNNSNSNSNANANPLTPTVSERKVKSVISVANGQTVLLAGLISERQERDRNGIPLLEQIPLLGDAFAKTNLTATRTEVIMFIRPQIIRDSRDAHRVAEELRDKLMGSGPSSPGPILTK
jgi:general secretion pathway protein D